MTRYDIYAQYKDNSQNGYWISPFSVDPFSKDQMIFRARQCEMEYKYMLYQVREVPENI